MIINSVTSKIIYFNFLSNSAIISSKTINIIRFLRILHFLFGLYSSMFLQTSSISFDYSIKDLKSLKYIKSVLSPLLIKN